MATSEVQQDHTSKAEERFTHNKLKAFPHLHPDRFSHIFRIGKDCVVKYGHGQDRLSEATTMRYIQANTAIPIPKVLDAYLDSENTSHGMLVMSYVEGDILQDVWQHLTSEAKAAIVAQLHTYVQQLRNIKGNYIGKIDSGACEDPMFDNHANIFYGPYSNESEFNSGMIAALRAKDSNAFIDMVADMVLCLQNHEIVLTHADLVPRNIIVRGEQVVAVLDWEMAGFWPEYWEYIKALYMPDWDEAWIKDRVTDKIMRPYHVEHAILRQVRDVFW